MKFAVGNTDHDWFTTLRNSASNGTVNFWTPTTWNLRTLSPGELWYFMLKSPIRQIGGYGYFKEYENMSASEAWHRFGVANGVRTRKELFERVENYAARRSKQKDRGNDPQIGCIVLSSPVFFDEDDYFDINEYGHVFPNQVVKFKTYPYFSINKDVHKLENFNNFQLVSSSEKDKQTRTATERRGQSAFRQKILRAYNHQCCLTETKISEVLEAAHIQPYVNKSSNHIQNGLCLRTDLHALFDRGLIGISDDYRLLLHRRLVEVGSTYRALDGQKIKLPSDERLLPSIDAVRYHRTQIYSG